jgi:5-methylcytosine-specific restriction endonuclease McrA
MPKNRYRVSISFSYDMQTDKEHLEAQEEAEKILNKVTAHLSLNRKSVRLERMKQPKHRIRLAEFPVDEVLPFISRESRKKEYVVDGKTYEVRMDSSRYFVFRENLCCSACGLKGVKFCLELSPSDKTPHFNLYAIENGHYILMTKDHIRPKSYGGIDIHSNYQTMCAICNNLKGSSNIPLEKIKELRKIYDTNKSFSRKKVRKLLEEARNQFKQPYGEPHLPKRNRKEYLAKLKSVESAVVTNTDLRIWRLNNGVLLGKSVYEAPMDGAVEIASVRIGTILIPVTNTNSKVIVRLDEETCEIYQGYLEFLTAE